MIPQNCANRQSPPPLSFSFHVKLQSFIFCLSLTIYNAPILMAGNVKNFGIPISGAPNDNYYNRYAMLTKDKNKATKAISILPDLKFWGCTRPSIDSASPDPPTSGRTAPDFGRTTPSRYTTSERGWDCSLDHTLSESKFWHRRMMIRRAGA